jgi:alpha-methylacyl-CoA racemase
MVDGAASLATYVHSMRAAGTWTDRRQSNVLDGGAPFYGVYATADGRYVAVGAIEPQFYAELLAGLGFDAASLPDQLDRSQWPAVRALFAERFGTRTRDEWEKVFAGTDACVTPVLAMGEAPLHPHLSERRSFVSVDGVVQPAPVPRFDGTPTVDPRPPSDTGSGGRAAMVDWGLPTECIDDWVSSGVVSILDPAR